MSVYVDDSYRITPGERSRMIADTTEELVALAARFGLNARTSRSSGDYVAVPLVCRNRVVAAGAIEITLRQFSLMSSRRRTTGELGAPGEAEAWFSAIYEAQVARACGAMQ